MTTTRLNGKSDPDFKSFYSAVSSTLFTDDIVLNYKDINEDAWYYASVVYVVNRNLFKGLSETSFGPDTSMTRGMFITVLSRLEFSSGEEVPPAGSLPFNDLSQSRYRSAIAWGLEKGIVAGTSSTSFAPAANVTREQIALFLHRYAKLKGYDLSYASSALAPYGDSLQISPSFEEALKWAISKNLLSGTIASTLDPKGEASRAQVAAIIMRFCQRFQ